MLHEWDFTRQPVSDHALDFLQSIYDQPLLCISAINPGEGWPVLTGLSSSELHLIAPGKLLCWARQSSLFAQSTSI